MRTTWISILAIAGGCSWFTSSSSSTVTLHSSERTPAATGEVSAIPAPNGNTEVTINVDHLAPPQRIMPGATTYVAWIVPGDHDEHGSTPMPTNAGAIRLGPDLHGQLQTVTPYKHFRIEVTPERTAMTEQPTGIPVLTAHLDRG
jgi:hypothetical protein